jgi:hypothetical protein
MVVLGLSAPQFVERWFGPTVLIYWTVLDSSVKFPALVSGTGDENETERRGKEYQHVHLLLRIK